VAVASRDAARAEDYAREYGLERAHGSYDALLADSGVEAVYISLPNSLHVEWSIRALEAGKHVLCEKPCAVTTPDLRVMLEACRSHGVQFMDGVMFLHSQRLLLLRQTLDDGQSIGTVRRITSQFSFKASDDFLTTNIRASNLLEPLGCLGDLGWYNIRFSLWVMNEQLPERVAGRLLAGHPPGAGPTGPTEFSGELFFPGGTSASFFTSYRTGNQQWATVSGTHGFLHMPDFVVPFFGNEVSFETNAPVLRVRSCCDFNMESHPRRLAVHEYSNGRPNAQETNMIRTFSGIVTSGKPEPVWGEMALKTQRVMDACLESARADGKAVAVTA